MSSLFVVESVTQHHTKVIAVFKTQTLAYDFCISLKIEGWHILEVPYYFCKPFIGA